ncbi:MAG TPA: glycosyltransferase family 1 protein [Pirellulales bacterium]
MRILVNGTPMQGRLTGIGQYGLRLLEALMALPDGERPERIGVFNGREVLSAESFFSGLVADDGGPRHERLKGLIRRIWPNCRDWADRVRRWRLAKGARPTDWSVFHEPNFVAPQYALPLVTTVHDMSYLRYPQFMPKDRVAWLRRRMGQSLRQSRVILADSHFTRQELLELCPQVDADRVMVTWLGVDGEYFADPIHAARLPEVRRRLGLPNEFVLYLGTLEPRKNLQGLISAYRRLPAEMQASYPLVLAGMSGWNQAFFRKELAELRERGVLYELGYVAQDDVPVLMRAASVFCFPSFYEGFGLPPLEAAACGTPVLASRAASLPEVLGQAAVYVDPHSPDDIAAGLRRVLDDQQLQTHLRLAGPARAAEFPWQRCARQTLAAYQRAA